MRDPKRMHFIIEAIAFLWARQPDTRLCQLLANAAHKHGWKDNDLFYLEDDKLLEALISCYKDQSDSPI